MAGTIKMTYEQDMLFGMLSILVVIAIFLLFPEYKTLNIMFGLILGLTFAFIAAAGSNIGEGTFYKIRYACIPNTIDEEKTHVQNSKDNFVSNSFNPKVVEQFSGRPQYNSLLSPVIENEQLDEYDRQKIAAVRKPSKMWNTVETHNQINVMMGDELNYHESAPWWSQNEY